ncbi:MAG TPA: hypothetical protein VIK04_10370 [Solirubrobacteraceae bacterium]
MPVRAVLLVVEPALDTLVEAVLAPLVDVTPEAVLLMLVATFTAGLPTLPMTFDTVPTAVVPVFAAGVGAVEPAEATVAVTGAVTGAVAGADVVVTVLMTVEAVPDTGTAGGGGSVGVAGGAEGAEGAEEPEPVCVGAGARVVTGRVAIAPERLTGEITGWLLARRAGSLATTRIAGRAATCVTRATTRSAGGATVTAAAGSAVARWRPREPATGRAVTSCVAGAPPPPRVGHPLNATTALANVNRRAAPRTSAPAVPSPAIYARVARTPHSIGSLHPHL